MPLRNARKPSRRRVARRGRKPREKRSEHVMTFLFGQHIYQSMYHEACSFAIDERIIGVPLVEFSIFIRKEQFDDLESRISNDAFDPAQIDPLTPCYIATSNGMSWRFQGYPLLIACRGDVQDGFKGILVTLRFPVTDIKCF